MITIRRALIIVLAIFALAAVPATAAGGFKTKVVVSLKFPAFHGKLVSSHKACLGHRKVKMYRERNGRKVLLGSDHSSPKGKWAIPVGKKLTSGSYFATVAKRGNCKGGKSGVLPID
jgi:hypothetical protein